MDSSSDPRVEVYCTDISQSSDARISPRTHHDTLAMKSPTIELIAGTWTSLPHLLAPTHCASIPAAPD